VSELDLRLLAVRKAGDLLALHQGFTLVGNMPEDAGRMTYQRDRLARVVERFEQRDRYRALSQIPHRTVSANIEHAVKILRFHLIELHRL
jgi:hypothetical protein